MVNIPFKNPKPDFELMSKVLNGDVTTDKVIMAELLIDEEVKKFIPEPGMENIKGSGCLWSK